eukprot:12285642-Alexandrium_andersonii.AAC.1
MSASLVGSEMCIRDRAPSNARVRNPKRHCPRPDSGSTEHFGRPHPRAVGKTEDSAVCARLCAIAQGRLSQAPEQPGHLPVCGT